MAGPQTYSYDHDRPVIGWVVGSAMAVVVVVCAIHHAGELWQRWQGDWSTGHAGVVAECLFGIFFIGAALSVLFVPRVSITISSDGVLLQETWLWRSLETRYAKKDVSVPEVVEDDEDFGCVLRLSGREVTIGSGSRKRMEVLRDDVAAAIRAD